MKSVVATSLARAHANAAPATTSPAASTESTKKVGAPKVADRVAPAFTNVRTDIAPPANASSNRGGKSDYTAKLAELPLNGSVGLTNKTKEQISSQISKLNNHRDNLVVRKDANGNPVMKPGKVMKDSNGNIIGTTPPTETEMDRVKEFRAYDVDPNTDPDKAKVRIFRIK